MQHMMRIVVDDNGPGIEPAQRELGVPSVLHVETKRHRAGPGPGPEDHRLSQRPHHRRHVAAGRRQPCRFAPDLVLPRLAPNVRFAQALGHPRLPERPGLAPRAPSRGNRSLAAQGRKFLRDP